MFCVKLFKITIMYEEKKTFTHTILCLLLSLHLKAFTVNVRTTFTSTKLDTISVSKPRLSFFFPLTIKIKALK